MAIIGATRFLERSRFFNGQRLFASDLQGVDDFNREMRWLHNKSLHQPGIGSGFAISGNKGDRQVVIQPGYAIDAEGREIVLAETTIVPVPPVAGDEFGAPVLFELTVSYPDERTLDASETREGVCAPRGAIRLREVPVFCWVRLGPPPDRQPTDGKLAAALKSGLHLRLARAQVLNCQLDRPLSLAQRRNAKPPEQPYVACGSFQPKRADWKLSAGVSGGFGLQLAAPVDTRGAGFRTPPSYSAHLLGGREFTFTVKANPVKRLLDGFVLLVPHAHAEAGFDLSLLVPDSLLTRFPADPTDPDPQTDPTFADQLLDQIVANEWRIDWIGVEG